MAAITFFTQAREDGGVRTGIEIDGLTFFEQFDSGADEFDPALRWYVDVRCQGRSLPREAEEARQWLLLQAKPIKSGLKKLADKLCVGIDREFYPLEWDIPASPRGVRMRIVCSVSRRMAGREIAGVLTDLAEHWEERLPKLPLVQATSL